MTAPLVLRPARSKTCIQSARGAQSCRAPTSSLAPRPRSTPVATGSSAQLRVTSASKTAPGARSKSVPAAHSTAAGTRDATETARSQSRIGNVEWICSLGENQDWFYAQKLPRTKRVSSCLTVQMSIKAAQLHAGTKAACEEASQGTTTIRIVAGPPDKHQGTLGDKKKHSTRPE